MKLKLWDCILSSVISNDEKMCQKARGKEYKEIFPGYHDKKYI